MSLDASGQFFLFWSLVASRFVSEQRSSHSFACCTDSDFQPLCSGTD